MTNDPKWKPCPPGMIRDVADRQRNADESSVMSRRTSLAAAAMLFAGAGYLIVSGQRIDNLNCSETRTLAQEFVLGQLTPQLATAVQSHCKSCPPCALHLQQVQETATL